MDQTVCLCIGSSEREHPIMPPGRVSQAQAGHRSIESTRVYLHLTKDWLAEAVR
jgi:hypothetical protein